MINPEHLRHYIDFSQKNFFLIAGNPAHGKSKRPIPIAIGKVGHLGKLTERNFGKLARIVNQVTLSRRYPLGRLRANHNGTHSARQARLLEVIFDTMAKGPAQKFMDLLSNEEKMHLKLGAYLLRSGRIDESSHECEHPDDYYTRSAMIYEAYALQMGTSKKVVRLVKNTIFNSCKLREQVDPEIFLDPKREFCWQCLSAAHDLDLLRTYSKEAIDNHIRGVLEERLSPYLSPSIKDQTIENLWDFSRKLCVATGCAMPYYEITADRRLFEDCSRNGEKCWQIVKDIPLSIDEAP